MLRRAKECFNRAMIIRRLLLIPLAMALLTACDTSCEDLQESLCTGPKGKSDPNCKYILDEDRSDALTDETCRSILDSMRE